MKRTPTTLLAVAACLVGAAPAHAAFAPDLTVGVTPDTAATNPSVTAAIAQPATDSQIERFTLHLPPGFTAAGAPGAGSCAIAAVGTGTCPAASGIGSFGMWLSPTARVTGTIYKTGPSGFALRVSSLGGVVGQVVAGTVIQRADGSLDMKLDQLPALPLTNLVFSFGGGPRSFIRTPDRCGSYAIDGKFTSRQSELAIDRTVMPITGCAVASAVQVANVRLSNWRFKAGGSRFGYRTTIAWWASQAVDHTDVRIERRVDGAWRAVGVLVATGYAGDNRVRWDGRLGNRALKPGRYGIRIQPAGGAPTKRVRFQILD